MRGKLQLSIPTATISQKCREANGQIERQTIAFNSIPKYYNFVRSNDGLYTDRFTIICLILGDRPSTFGT